MGSRRLVALCYSFEGLTADAYGLAEKELALDAIRTVLDSCFRKRASCRLGMHAQRMEMDWAQADPEPVLDSS